MGPKELYDEYMITSMVAGFEPVVVERAFGNVVRLQPPLVITEEQTEMALGVLREALLEVAGDG